MQRGVTDHCGRTNLKLREAKDAVLTACLLDENISKGKVRERLGVISLTISKFDRTSESVIYEHSKPKLYVNTSSTLMCNSIYDFCHSEESSTTDSISCKINEVNGEKHVGRVWLVPIIRDQYKLFKQDIVQITKYVPKLCVSFAVIPVLPEMQMCITSSNAILCGN